MQENNGHSKTDWARVDAHVIQPHEYEEIPELTDEWFEAANIYVGGKLVQRGRPRKATPKKATSLRLDAAVIDAFRARGKGWQTQINTILAAWLSAHPQQQG